MPLHAVGSARVSRTRKEGHQAYEGTHKSAAPSAACRGRARHACAADTLLCSSCGAAPHRCARAWRDSAVQGSRCCCRSVALLTLRVRRARPAQRATLRCVLSLLLALVARAVEPKNWMHVHAARERAAGVQVTQLRSSPESLRCRMPAVAVTMCLERRPGLSLGACMELAAYLMAPQQLTRAGFAADSEDMLYCFYLALASAPPRMKLTDTAPDTAWVMSLGLLLSTHDLSETWLQSLLRFDEAPLSQPRLHKVEAGLRDKLRGVSAAAHDNATALMLGAEALELFAALRSAGLSWTDDARVADTAARVEDFQLLARTEKKGLQSWRNLAQQLAKQLRDDSGGGRAAIEARARKLLNELDLASQGDCRALAAHLENCAAVVFTSETACMPESVRRLHRALDLTHMDECARDVVATTSNVVALFGFMNLMGTKRHLGEYMAHLVLPPPRGEAPHAKSPEAERPWRRPTASMRNWCCQSCLQAAACTRTTTSCAEQGRLLRAARECRIRPAYHALHLSLFPQSCTSRRLSAS